MESFNQRVGYIQNELEILQTNLSHSSIRPETRTKIINLMFNLNIQLTDLLDEVKQDEEVKQDQQIIITNNSQEIITCAICYETHNNEKIIKTSCDHYFGMSCYNKWIEECITRNNSVTCPCCRELTPTYITL